jgi:GDP-mannose 6-dehydrogenase
MSDNAQHRIVVVGLGYVGCVSVACLASSGHVVTGVDVDASKVGLINAGTPTIVEPGLDDLMAETIATGRIRATTDLEGAVADAEVSLVTVGTPRSPDGELDLKHIFSVAQKIGHALRRGTSHHTIAIRSTIRPGTCGKVIDIIERASGRRHGEEFSVVVNPEFLREGTAINDYRNPPYILIGASELRGAQAVAAVYADVNAETVIVGQSTAEVIKYVNNSWHALKVAFGNEVGSVTHALGIDSREVFDVFLRDQHLNISPAYLRPGFAFGGACLPKDLSALVALARSCAVAAPLLDSVALSNEHHLERGVALVRQYSAKRIGVLGLSFKAGTDDVRSSPAVSVVRALKREGYNVVVYDEEVRLSLQSNRNTEFFLTSLGDVASCLVPSLEALLGHAEVLVVAKRDPTFEPILLAANRPIVDLVCMGPAVTELDGYVGLAW